MMPPMITILDRDDVSTRYCIRGGEIAPDWEAALRPGEEPACAFTLWGRDDRVTSYGGTVWPTAWPALFAPVPPSVQAGTAGIVLTPAGRSAVDAAALAYRSTP